MRNTTIISTTLLLLVLIGCGSDSQDKTSAPEPVAPLAKVAPTINNTHGNISTETPGVAKTITVAGNTFNVTVKGSITPNAVLDVSIVQSSGPAAAAIRVWVGDASGVGSMKIKVHSHGASSHAHAKAPAKLPANSALWIEVQNADGTSGSGSIQVD